MENQEVALLKSQNLECEPFQVEDQSQEPSHNDVGEYLCTSSLSIEIMTPNSFIKDFVSHEHHKNPFLGYTFICISVLGMTVVHIASKIAFTRKETLTNVDCITFYGIWLTLVYSVWSRLAGANLSLKNLPKRPIIGLFGSCISSIICNVFMFKGVKMISVGKSTLIFSTNPVFSMIFAAILLSEQISKPVVLSTIGSFVGIYFLTLNKDNVTEESHLYLGILFSLAAALFQSFIFIFVRMVSVYKLHFTMRPTYAGLSFLGFGCLTALFYPEGISFQEYTAVDIINLSCVGLGSC
jgi:drug/metabolite transporter (DMT)-like permease